MIDKIKIGWKEYGVKILDKKIYLGVVATDYNEVHGDTDFDNQEIRVTRFYGEDNLRATLVHEVLHGIDEMQGIGLSEEMITALGNGIYAVLKDNNLKIVKE